MDRWQAGLPTEERIYVDRWLGSSVDSGITGLLGLRPGLATRYSPWSWTRRDGLEPQAVLPPTSWDREKRTSPFLWAQEGEGSSACTVVLTCWSGHASVPSLWAWSLGRLGLFLGLGWGSGAGFRCSSVNRRKRGQMAGGF